VYTIDVKRLWILVFGAMLAGASAYGQQAAQNAPQAGASAENNGDADKNEAEANKKPVIKPYVKPVGKWIFSFGGGIVLFAEDGGIEAAPAPVLPMPFASFDWVALRRGLFNLALDSRLAIYWTDYLWDDGRPYPAMIETRQSFVLGFVPSLEAKAYIQLSYIMLKAGLGISADMRVVTAALDLNDADKKEAPVFYAGGFRQRHFHKRDAYLHYRQSIKAQRALPQ
jgi:hypothetical protein